MAAVCSKQYQKCNKHKFCNSSGYILIGLEYYTLFDRTAGAALDTVSYKYPRGEVSKKTWGDDYGNRNFLPDRKGKELWVSHEHEPYGVSLLDTATGMAIFHYNHCKDTGRCAAGNIYAENPGAVQVCKCFLDE